MLIDIGGTPANILEKNKLRTARAQGIKDEDIVIILDPFDLSRKERKFNYKGISIKFSIETKDVNIDSEKKIPYIKNNPPNEIKKIIDSSVNLRELMNNLVKFTYPKIKTIKLENILAKNKEVIYNILKKTKIPVRAFCPKCGYIRNIILGDNMMCCSVSDKDIINSGKYIPQKGFFALITYLCGYKTLSNNKEKINQTIEIMKKINIKGYPFKKYSDGKEEK
jgi:hypothetical protein